MSLATGEAATQGSAAEDATAASDTPKPLREPKEGETSVAQFLADVRFVISKLIGAADSTDEDTLVNASSDATSAATLLTRIRVLGKGVSLPEGGLPLPSFPNGFGLEIPGHVFLWVLWGWVWVLAIGLP